jgi:hypothetical protein
LKGMGEEGLVEYLHKTKVRKFENLEMEQFENSRPCLRYIVKGRKRMLKNDLVNSLIKQDNLKNRKAAINK